MIVCSNEHPTSSPLSIAVYSSMSCAYGLDQSPTSHIKIFF